MRDHGLSNNERDFPTQLAPDAAGIVAAFDSGNEVTAAQARAAAPGSVVRFRATARPGPGGPLTAPLSGQPCVWYRCYVQPAIDYGSGLRPLPELAPSDSVLIHNTGTALFRRRLNASGEISTAAFRVGDEQTWFDIDPRGADVDTDVLAVNRVDSGGHWWNYRCLLVEWILPPDAPVLVVGTTDGQGRLRLAPDAALLVTTKTPENVLARNRPAASRDSASTADRTLRVTASGERFAQGVRIFVIVLVVAVVLVIAGSFFI